MDTKTETLTATVYVTGKPFEMELEVLEEGFYWKGMYIIYAKDKATGMSVARDVNLKTGEVSNWEATASGGVMPDVYR